MSFTREPLAPDPWQFRSRDHRGSLAPDPLDPWPLSRVLLMDGAMGTELQRAGLRVGECAELWNLTRPELVRAIHQSYRDAGARCLLTNTFQANPLALERHGLRDRLQEINQAAVALARSAADADCFVLGDIGPLGDGGKEEAISELVTALRDADGLLLETCSDLARPGPREAGDRSNYLLPKDRRCCSR